MSMVAKSLMKSKRDIILHLSLIKGVGPAAIQHLLSIMSHDSLCDLYAMSVQELVQRCRLTLKQAHVVHDGLADKKMLDDELAALDKHKICLIMICDEAYPKQLSAIYLPPPVLYCRGNVEALHQKSLALVGSRKATSYAQRSINMLVPSLVANQWAIVSGGAVGADTMAHEETLKAGGVTIAVLGSGLLNVYPQSNKKLFDAIVAHNGLLLSSFSMHAQPLPGNFPARNRIIAGLSRGCLVVEAAEKSGACITACFALEQSREVFALPGPIDSPFSAGCNRLIQQGARLVMEPIDIFEQFHEYVRVEKREEIVVGNDNKQAAEQGLYSFITHNPQDIEQLSTASCLKVHEVQQGLFDLQLEGKITHDHMGRWYRA